MRADITVVLKARIIINGDQPIKVSNDEMRELMLACGLREHFQAYLSSGDDSITHRSVDAFALEALVITAINRQKALTQQGQKTY